VDAHRQVQRGRSWTNALAITTFARRDTRQVRHLMSDDLTEAAAQMAEHDSRPVVRAIPTCTFAIRFRTFSGVYV